MFHFIYQSMNLSILKNKYLTIAIDIERRDWKLKKIPNIKANITGLVHLQKKTSCVGHYYSVTFNHHPQSLSKEISRLQQL
ncbi:hypothetical protein DERF_006274 [Dermatophagoides farinae]|uniref:Uncharacterized protein n=1 Tax=Dermatophagoides farinae TaxID=6954 RepID=A0A922I780_DERFA|nr:hypothetical protein DERF_006274 [Dermatophagoides farinae]